MPRCRSRSRTRRSIRLRILGSSEPLSYKGRPNLQIGGISWPVFAVIGGIATFISFLVILVQNPATRWVGLGWLVFGLIGYTIYRRRFVQAPVTEIVRAPALVLGPSLTVEYRTILVPVVRSAESEEALVAAARLASERGSRIAILHVIEMPLDLPLDGTLSEAEEDAADELLDDAEALVERYGVPVVTRLVRARAAGPAIVQEAMSRSAELVALGAPRKRRFGTENRAVFGRTVDYVLKASQSRVMVVAGRRAA